MTSLLTVSAAAEREAACPHPREEQGCDGQMVWCHRCGDVLYVFERELDLDPEELGE